MREMIGGGVEKLDVDALRVLEVNVSVGKLEVLKKGADDMASSTDFIVTQGYRFNGLGGSVHKNNYNYNRGATG